MINCLDWVHLQAAIDFPGARTTGIRLSFDCWYFDIQFIDPMTIYLSWELKGVKRSVAKISFVGKVEGKSYFCLDRTSMGCLLPISEKFTLSELFMVLWEIQKTYESKEYQFIKEVMS